jgi:hypothetical protein
MKRKGKGLVVKLHLKQPNTAVQMSMYKSGNKNKTCTQNYLTYDISMTVSHILHFILYIDKHSICHTIVVLVSQEHLRDTAVAKSDPKEATCRDT